MNLPACNTGTGDDRVCNGTVYDQYGRSIATIDPLGKFTRTYYDELNHSILVVQNVDAYYVYTNTETLPGCAETSGDEAHICTRTVYDVSGQTIATTDPLNVTTRTFYDELGRVLRLCAT